MKVIDSGQLPADVIMAKDEEFLAVAQPILHLYEWEGPSLTYGYFVNPADHLNLDELNQCKIKMARRPTGGGIIFHLTDFAFSMILSEFPQNTMDSYAYVNGMIAKALSPLIQDPFELMKRDNQYNRSFCMAGVTPFDIIIKGKKVGGAAQRRKKNVLLHQGSISLKLPPVSLLKRVVKDQTMIQQMESHTYEFEGDLKTLREQVKSLIFLECGDLSPLS